MTSEYNASSMESCQNGAGTGRIVTAVALAVASASLSLLLGGLSTANALSATSDVVGIGARVAVNAVWASHMVEDAPEPESVFDIVSTTLANDASQVVDASEESGVEESSGNAENVPSPADSGEDTGKLKAAGSPARDA